MRFTSIHFTFLCGLKGVALYIISPRDDVGWNCLSYIQGCYRGDNERVVILEGYKTKYIIDHEHFESISR